MAEPPNHDERPDLRAALERELYWAEEGTPLARTDTAGIRDALHDFAALMRADEKELVPRGEPNLAAVTRWKRQAKLRLFRSLRPVTRRYDRLLAELGGLARALAERVVELEAEVERLRAELRERDGGGGRG